MFGFYVICSENCLNCERSATHVSAAGDEVRPDREFDLVPTEAEPTTPPIRGHVTF